MLPTITLRTTELRSALTATNRGTPGIRAGELAATITAEPETATAPECVTLTATDGYRTVTVTLTSGTVTAGVPVTFRFRHASLVAALKGAGRTVTLAADATTLAALPTGDGFGRLYRGARLTVGALTLPIPDQDGPETPDYATDFAAGPIGLADLVPVAAVASRDACRPILTAVSLRDAAEPGTIECAGTDSYRLACRRTFGPSIPDPILVPADVITAAARNLGAGDPAPVLAYGARHYRISAGNADYRGDLVSGDFPAYHQLAPAADALAVWTVERQALATVTALAAARKNPDGPLIITAGPDGITAETLDGIATALPGAGPAAPHRFGIDPAFLADALRANSDAAGDLVTFRTDTPLRPFYVDTVTDAPDRGLPTLGRSLVMPVRLG